MMMDVKEDKSLKVHQIYFDPAQATLLEPEYIPYYNPDCTVYFENSVIETLINCGAHVGCDYFGVVSYKLREKIGAVMKERWTNIPTIANHSLKEFTPALFESELLSHRPDVMSFQRHMPHDPITFADRFHPNFSNYFQQIMNEIGFDWKPTHLKNVVYCNFFVAKSEIYKRYVSEMLIPAMNVMRKMEWLYNNSHYPNKMPENLAKQWGIDYYPYHPFMCERMFSWYMHVNNLNCKHF